MLFESKRTFIKIYFKKKKSYEDTMAFLTSYDLEFLFRVLTND